MASIKTGFNYYNLETERYKDIKIRRLKKDFGCSGIAVYDYILCEIYRVKGCILVWGESSAFDVADYFGLKESVVLEIVNYCGIVGLFDRGLLTCGSVITSQSIQRRYVDMCIRAKRDIIVIPEEYNILTEEYRRSVEEYNGRGSKKDIKKKGGVKIEHDGIRKESDILTEECEIIQEESDNSIRVKKEKKKENENTFSFAEADASAIVISEFDFEKVWELYGRKGNLQRSKSRWNALSKAKKRLAMAYIPAYVEATPDKTFRKAFEGFISLEKWNDELPIRSARGQPAVQAISEADFMSDINRQFKTTQTKN